MQVSYPRSLAAYFDPDGHRTKFPINTLKRLNAARPILTPANSRIGLPLANLNNAASPRPTSTPPNGMSSLR